MGMVRQWQEFFYEGRYAMSYMDAIPNFAKLAESFGHIGMVIDNPKNLEKDLTHALSLKDRLVFVDVITDETENVYPMIMNGKGHHEMHLAPSANEDIELA
jgi:acetolactate synthase-1/2/3 large subunit